MAGLFIAFEGGEGAGKTTQAGILRKKLTGLSIPCELFREPGGTAIGEYLRTYLKSHRPLAPEAELLLFEAARAQLIIEEIQPALAEGRTVIADRFAASTVSYQGHGRGIDLGVVTALNGFATQGIRPDIVILLDVPPVTGLSRSLGGIQLPFAMDWSADISPNNARKIDDRRFEDLDLLFHEKVRQGFKAQAEVNSKQWVVIDAELSVESVEQLVWESVKDRLDSIPRTLIPKAVQQPASQALQWSLTPDDVPSGK